MSATATPGEVRVVPAALRALVCEIFTAAGCPPAEGARIAHHLVAANLAGHDSHGVIRVPRYLVWLREGNLVADRKVAVLAESPGMAVLDGCLGFGQTVGPQAVRVGIDKARADGVAVIALRRSGHLGRIADWAEMAAEAGLVSLHLVNVAGSLLVAPFGGVERRLSTAPIAIGVPVEDGEPLVLDFATSRVAEGKVLVAASGGKPLPPDALIEADGRLSGDPRVLYGDSDPTRSVRDRWGSGALRAMGDHKGSGLALMCELLAGALTGNGCAGPDRCPISNGMLSVYLVRERFDVEGDFAAELRRYLEFVCSSRPDRPGGEVLLPGEPERRTRALREAAGIPLPAGAWQAIGESATELGVELPETINQGAGGDA